MSFTSVKLNFCLKLNIGDRLCFPQKRNKHAAKHLNINSSSCKSKHRTGKKTARPGLMNQLSLLLLLIPQRTSKDEKQNISTFCWFKSSVRLFSPSYACRQSDVQSGFRSSNIRKFTGFPPLKLFYKNMKSDGRWQCQI